MKPSGLRSCSKSLCYMASQKRDLLRCTESFRGWQGGVQIQASNSAARDASVRNTRPPPVSTNTAAGTSNTATRAPPASCPYCLWNAIFLQHYCCPRGYGSQPHCPAQHVPDSKSKREVIIGENQVTCPCPRGQAVQESNPVASSAPTWRNEVSVSHEDS